MPVLEFQRAAFKRSRRRRDFAGWVLVAAWIAAGIGWVGTVNQSRAQQLRWDFRNEVANQESFWSLQNFPSQPYMKEIYWQYPSDIPAFFREALMQYVIRTYYFTRDNFNGSKSQAWTVGGWLAFRSGLIGDIFGVHAAFYTSQKLFGPLDEDGSKLLAPGQNSLGVLGQIYGRVQIVDQEIRVGRQLVDTPLINPQDTRMVPNTFEGATLITLPNKDRNYDYDVGYLWSIKQRDSNDFIPMSDALVGNDVVNQGAVFGMVKYRPFSGLSIQAMDYNIQDFVNTGFVQAEYDFKQPKEVPNWIVGANIIDQRSVGADLLTGTAFETYQASAEVEMVYTAWTLFVAGSITGNGSHIFSPFGIAPNYTNMLEASFSRAGEKAFGGSVAYDFGYAFSAIGLSGLKAGAWYTHGWDAIDPSTNLGLPDRDELDLGIQYRPTEGPLKGLRVKTTYANIWQQGNVRETQPEFRFIIDYTVLFRPPIK